MFDCGVTWKWRYIVDNIFFHSKGDVKVSVCLTDSMAHDAAKNRTQRALVLIFGATLVVKLALMLLVIPTMAEYLPYSIANFGDRYDRIAENLLAGNGYRIYPETSETLLRSPGYVFLLTGIFYLFGKSLLAAQVANILCGLATT